MMYKRGDASETFTASWNVTKTENSLPIEVLALFGIFELQSQLATKLAEIETNPDLSFKEGIVVLSLWRPLRIGQIARILNCKPPNATSVVDGLVRAKLVERLPDPLDRRAILLELTAEGKVLQDQLISEICTSYRQVTQHSDHQTQGLVGLLSPRFTDC